MVNAELFAVRKRKPRFIRQDYHWRQKVQDDTWRRPKGKHSKTRQHRTGNPAWVEVGYRMPREIRGLHSSGLQMVRVENPGQLLHIAPKEEIAIMGRVGDRLKIQLLKKAQDFGIKFVNVKDISKEIIEIENKLKERKEAKADKKKQKEEKSKAKPKEKPKKEKVEEKKEEVKPKEIKGAEAGKEIKTDDKKEERPKKTKSLKTDETSFSEDKTKVKLVSESEKK